VVAAVLLVAGTGSTATASVKLTPVDAGDERPVTAAFPTAYGGVGFGADGVQAPGTSGPVLHTVDQDHRPTDAIAVDRSLAGARIVEGAVRWIVFPPRPGAERSAIVRESTTSLVHRPVEQSVPADASITRVPDRVALGADGALWLAGTGHGTVTRITPGGAARRWSLPRSGAPDDAAVEPAADGRVWIARGRTLTAFTRRGPARHLALPFAVRSMTAGFDGALWAVGRTGRIVRISPAGSVRVLPVRVPGGRSPEIVAGPSRHLWLTVPATGRLMELAPDGKATLHRVGLTPARTGVAVAPGSLVAVEAGVMPLDGAAVPDRALWVRTAWGLASVALDHVCQAPNLVGRIPREARAIAAAAACPVAEHNRPPASSGVVTGQSPGARQWLDAGGPITLTYGPVPVGAATCRFPLGVPLVAESPELVVRGDGDALYLCRRADGHVRPLRTGPFGGVRDFVFAGQRLAYVADSKVGGGYFGATLVVVDGVDDPGGRSALLGMVFGTISTGQPGGIHDLTLAADGTAAWIGHETRWSTEPGPAGGLPDCVWVLSPEHGRQLLATGAPESLTDLTIDGETASWRESGAPRSAPLP